MPSGSASRWTRSVLPVLALAVWLAPAPGRGAALIIDQSAFPGGIGGDSYPPSPFPLRQSFKPALASMGFVELGLTLSTGEPPGLLRVDIRDGGVAGPVIASSGVFVLEDSHPLPISMLDLSRFEFSPPVALVPGSTYVIDLIHVSGGIGLWNIGSVYPDGMAYNRDGSPGIDRVFRTGLVVPSQIVTDPQLPLEYSDSPDERALPGGDDHDVPDPGQVLYTEPVDAASNALPADVSDFSPALESGTDFGSQVDALASSADAFVDALLSNDADLLVSLTGDGAVAEAAAFFESPTGATGIFLKHPELNALDGPPGEIDDVDALELWGPVNGSDAVYFSRFDDIASGTSVFRWSAGVVVPWVSHAEIVAAVTALGFVGSSQEVDLDALLVENGGDEQNFDVGDGILFSIRAGGSFDGGEIIHLRAGAFPEFLEHGGHLWDTAFGVMAALPGADKEDVDALEAGPPTPPGIPALGPAALAAAALALVAVAAARRLRGRARSPTP